MNRTVRGLIDAYLAAPTDMQAAALIDALQEEHGHGPAAHEHYRACRGCGAAVIPAGSPNKDCAACAGELREDREALRRALVASGGMLQTVAIQPREFTCFGCGCSEFVRDHYAGRVEVHRRSGPLTVAVCRTCYDELRPDA